MSGNESGKMCDLYEYDGYLNFAPLNEDQVKNAHELIKTAGVCAQLEKTWFELSYQGRDYGRWMLRLLQELATIIGDADGEIACRPNLEGSDPEFIFYEIKNGKLYYQEGKVIRGEKHEL